MDKLTPVEIQYEMKDSYIDYAMSVIVSRALPDVRDGLKPVHRRILYAMDNLNLTPDKPFKKSATIVGDVLGKYHPHGDFSVYDALVRLAQDFNMRYPLVQGHGNFGSIDGDTAAAYRYTEARMAKLSLELLADLDKETVDFTDNFDASLQEPTVLPSKIPNLLVNGSTGIAVGMSTNIPPHNLGEVSDALIYLIDNPEADIEDLINIVKAPDFPTGALIMGTGGCREAYRTGKGLVTMRAKIEDKEKKNGRHTLVVTEIPYQINKSRLIEQIADGIREKKISHVTELRDESNREGMRIVFELAQNANVQLVLNQLYKHSNLQCNFGIIMLALVDGEPKLLSLKDLLSHFLAHRKDVTTRKARYELKKALNRRHILEGLKIALDNIEEIISIIRSSSDNKEAKKSMYDRFSLTDIQAQSILEMQLQRLTGLQRNKIDEEYSETLEKIKYLNELLANEAKIMNVIKEELIVLKEKYADPRRTQIIAANPEIMLMDDLIPVQDAVITISESGYIKRMSPEIYKMQNRGGKGVIGASLKEEDRIRHLCFTTTHNYLLFITNKGKIYRLKAYEISESGRHAKGTALINLIPSLSQDELISSLVPVKELSDAWDLVVATAQGRVKKTSLSLYKNITKTGIKTMRLNENDDIIGAALVSHSKAAEFMVISRFGKCIRFRANEVRNMARDTGGVKTMNFDKEGDGIVSFVDTAQGKYLMVITSNGYALRTSIEEYSVKGRRGKGIRVMQPSEDKGYVAAARMVNDNEEILVVSKDGIVIRTNSSQLPEGGRYRQGNVLMKLSEGDVVSAVTVIRPEVSAKTVSERSDDENISSEDSSEAEDVLSEDFAEEFFDSLTDSDPDVAADLEDDTKFSEIEEKTAEDGGAAENARVVNPGEFNFGDFA